LLPSSPWKEGTHCDQWLEASLVHALPWKGEWQWCFCHKPQPKYLNSTDMLLPAVQYFLRWNIMLTIRENRLPTGGSNAKWADAHFRPRQAY
jgi:hypothetical protein